LVGALAMGPDVFFFVVSPGLAACRC